MKNLKRSLSLVLVLAFIVGLLGVGAAATDFTDDAEIKYNEAVGVLTGIGAIDGYPDGSFNPTGLVTRAEAIKLVAFAVLGADAARQLGNVMATSSFTDCGAADVSWAIPYIEWGVQQGIINGKGGGIFDPRGNVTGFELAKMLLVALGYGIYDEFVGANWSIAVAKLAVGGILSGNIGAVNYSSAVTREEACLYIFNTIINEEIVDWDTNLNAYVPSTMYPNGIWGKVYQFPTNPANSLMRGLASTATSTDDYGRPSNVWRYMGEDIGAFPIAPVASWTNSLTSANDTVITNAIKGFDLPGTVNPYRNNRQTGNIAATAANIRALTGNGVSVELYDRNNDKVIDTVVVVSTDLAEVSLVNVAGKAVTLASASSAPIVTGTPYRITDADDDLYDVVKNLDVDDLVIVTPRWNGAAYVANEILIPGTVKGFITATGLAAGSVNAVTIDGTRYSVGAAASADAMDPAETMPDSSNEATLFLDAYGYVLEVDMDAPSAMNFLLVTDTWQESVNGRLRNIALGVMTDGTEVEVAVTNTAPANGVYSVSAPDSSTGLRTLTLLNATTATGTPSTVSTGTGVTQVATPLTTTLATRDLSQAQQGGSNYHSNVFAADVRFFFYNPANGRYTVRTGMQVLTTFAHNVTNVATGRGGYAVIEERRGEFLITAVYLNADAPNLPGDTSNLLYFPRNTVAGVVPGSGGGTWNTYTAFENGTSVGNIPADPAPSAGGFYTYTKNSAGRYLLAAYAPASGARMVSTGTMTSASVIDEGVMIQVGSSFYTISGLAAENIIDARTGPAINSAPPITLTPKGICTALTSGDYSDITVDIVYNGSTNAISMIYIRTATVTPPTTITAAAVADITITGITAPSGSGAPTPGPGAITMAGTAIVPGAAGTGIFTGFTGAWTGIAAAATWATSDTITVVVTLTAASGYTFATGTDLTSGIQTALRAQSAISGLTMGSTTVTGWTVTNTGVSGNSVDITVTYTLA